MDRDSIIEKLIRDRIDTIKSQLNQDDYSYLSEILDSGFDGFINFTDEELITEYNHMFGENYYQDEEDKTFKRCAD